MFSRPAAHPVIERTAWLWGLLQGAPAARAARASVPADAVDRDPLDARQQPPVRLPSEVALLD